MSRRIAVLMVAATVAAIAASPAAAQAGPQGYSTPAGEVQADVSRGGGAPAPARPRAVQAETSSHLPFTGLDVGLLAGVGLGLLLVGAGLSRLAAVAADRRS